MCVVGFGVGVGEQSLQGGAFEPDVEGMGAGVFQEKKIKNILGRGTR